jgi:hypothetical protein
MIDPSIEKLQSFKQATQFVPVPPSMHTVRNWALHGAHGVYLEYVKIRGRYYTSEEAMQRFLERSRENGWRGVWNGRAHDAAMEQEREQAN